MIDMKEIQIQTGKMNEQCWRTVASVVRHSQFSHSAA